MVDPIGIRPGTIAERRTAPISDSVTSATTTPSVVKVAEVASVSTGSETIEIGAKAAAKQMAASPPVDQERVEQIRSAIAKGRFPIVPALIADRIIAYKEGWRG